jgi:hypothetical protein
VFIFRLLKYWQHANFFVNHVLLLMNSFYIWLVFHR